jgi:MoaA/NifB/PqqE/SkfB family radical SAM enzyme
MYFINLLAHISNVLLHRPDLKKVRAVNFAVTYRCDSKCKTCNIWKRYKNNPAHLKSELKLEEIKKIFEDSMYMKKLQSIGLTGGEPFLREDFVDLYGFFIQRYPHARIGISTNALTSDLILNTLSEIDRKFHVNNLFISISLDGIGKTHDMIRGVSGNYEMVIKLIDTITENFPLLELGVNFTIIPENHKDLLKVYYLSKDKKINFGCQFGQVSSCYYGNSEKSAKEFMWNDDELCRVEKMIRVIIKDHRNTICALSHKVLKKSVVNNAYTYYLSRMVDFQRNPKRMIPCYSGINSLFIDPYGDMYPCIMLNKKIGNALGGFDGEWLSHENNMNRTFIQDENCSCWTPCETFHSLETNRGLLLSNIYTTMKENIG